MIVELEGLQKVYDGKQRVVAVDGIDLNVHEGELYGLLGPNGAGKTTTISICTTRALPTAGRVRIAGIDVVADTGDGATMHWSRAAVQHARPRLHDLRKYLLSLSVTSASRGPRPSDGPISCSHSFT